MCNVILFRFTCTHTQRLRRSHCAGTKHKPTQTSLKAACTAESFLTLCLRTPCGPCQQATFDTQWTLKLFRAKTFLQKLAHSNLPGTHEIAALVRDLEHQYTSASWAMRNKFAQTRKSSVMRVRVSHYKKAHSPLRSEVRPEDVVEPLRDKTWAEMNESDYDGNYIASTDPIHPVCTDYSHPLDDDDGSWVLNYLSAEELENDDGGNADSPVDFERNTWTWEDETSADDEMLDATTQPEKRGLDTETGTEQQNRNPNSSEKAPDEHLTAWGPNAETTPPPQPSIRIYPMIGLRDKNDVQKERVEQVINAFWTLVNADCESEEGGLKYPPSSHDEAICNLLHALDILKV